jgi:zinc-ribbon domain
MKSTPTRESCSTMMISKVYQEVVMAYMCEISPGRQVYIDAQGNNTIVTVMTGGPGQQQQASNSFQTGHWVSPPEMFEIPQGVAIKIRTTQGEHYIRIQGGSMTLGNDSGVAASQQMQMHQADAPSAPSMQPMKMGNMEMNNNPMEMRMGNMHMQMGHMRMGEPIQPSQPAQSAPSTPSSQSAQPTRKFCSQCGIPVEPSDRFCSSCGHRLV